MVGLQGWEQATIIRIPSLMKLCTVNKQQGQTMRLQQGLRLRGVIAAAHGCDSIQR